MSGYADKVTKMANCAIWPCFYQVAQKLKLLSKAKLFMMPSQHKELHKDIMQQIK
jgi:hypothetical protein